MRSPQVNSSIMERRMKIPGFNCENSSCCPLWQLKIMQQCWKGSVEQWTRQAVGRTQIQEIVSLKILFPPHKTLTEGVGMQQFCKVSCSKWTLLQADFTHAAYLQQQKPGFTWWLMGARSWSVSLGWDFNVTTSKQQALGKIAWKRGRKICGAAWLPPAALKLTTTVSPKQHSEFMLQPQPLQAWLQSTRSTIALYWWISWAALVLGGGRPGCAEPSHAPSVVLGQSSALSHHTFFQPEACLAPSAA